MKQAVWRWAKSGLMGAAALMGLLVLAMVLYVIVEKHRVAQFNKTYESPLEISGSAAHLMNELRPVSGDNNLRFIVMPSFGDRWFAVSVSERDGHGVGKIIVETVAEKAVINGVSIVEPLGTGHRVQRNFTMPLVQLRRFFMRWDALTDGYTGEGRGWADGNYLSFERRRRDRVTSGSGNSPCHYDVLGDWAAQQLTPFAPELRDLRAVWLEAMLKSDTCNRSIFSLR